MGKDRKGLGDGVVRLSIEVPKGLAQFFADLCQFGGCQLSLKEWAERELVEAGLATIDQIDDAEFLDKSCLRKKYGLEEKLGDP